MRSHYPTFTPETRRRYGFTNLRYDASTLLSLPYSAAHTFRPKNKYNRANVLLKTLQAPTGPSPHPLSSLDLLPHHLRATPERGIQPYPLGLSLLPLHMRFPPLGIPFCPLPPTQTLFKSDL